MLDFHRKHGGSVELGGRQRRRPRPRVETTRCLLGDPLFTQALRPGRDRPIPFLHNETTSARAWALLNVHMTMQSSEAVLWEICCIVLSLAVLLRSMSRGNRQRWITRTGGLDATVIITAPLLRSIMPTSSA